MLKEYIQKHRPILESTIQDLLLSKKNEHKDQPLYVQSIDALLNCVSEGKMLRGLFVVFSYEAGGEKANEEVYKIAASMEIFHTALLIHDDILDNDLTRRGKPTTFAQYKTEGEKNKAIDSHLYGQSMAICVADFAFFLAYETLAKSHFDSAVVIKIVQTFSEELQNVSYAQLCDVQYGQTPYEPTKAEILTLYRYKTARYSFSLPLIVGSTLAHTDETIISKLDQLGESLGIIFQIKDDELNIFGDSKATGKPVGSDIRENKKTLMRQLTYDKSNQSERTKLNFIFGHKVTEEHVSHIKSVVEEKRINQELNIVIDSNVQKVRLLLSNVSLPEEKKVFLNELLEFNLTRIK